MADSREDRIRARAHQIWLGEGQPSGHEQRHWEQAAAEVDAEDAKAKKPAAKKAPAAKKPVAAKADAKKTSGAAPAIAKTSKDAKKPAKKP
ncbi:MAG: DUF2934 domain-containing protein [Rhizobiaceae bacterium]